MTPEDYFKKGKIRVSPKTFAIIKANKPIPGAFAVIQDEKETTVVIDQSFPDSKNIIAIEKGWKLLTFDLVLPFNLVGFLAKISQALALHKISIFVLSAYSTDHILVKEKDLKRTLKTLKELGFNIYFE